MSHLHSEQLDCPHFLQQVLISLPHAAFICTPDGGILTANPGAESIFGHPAEFYPGLNIRIFFTHEDVEILYANLLYMAQDKKTVNEEVMLVRRSGIRFMARIHLHPYSHKDQSLLLVHIQDINHQKQMKKVLREIGYQDLLLVANGVGHEIRNPLLIIGGYLRKMYTSCKATAEDDTYYRCIVDNLKKIENIVHKIDFFADPPKPAFANAPTPLVVELGLQPLRNALQKAEVHCVIDVEPKSLLMDQNQISKALEILVENAAETLPKGGEIRITGHSEDPWYIFNVQDNGPGIPEKDLPSIFRPFFSTKPQCAGIDLPILKRIIDNHQGQVNVSSEPDQGTCFTILLPLERRRLIRRTCMHPEIEANGEEDT